ncbi:MAG: hypothetical protein JNN02_04585 [Tabrizicola sp.]|nr:hypothetical protein [Tabrizicola sp.]
MLKGMRVWSVFAAVLAFIPGLTSAEEADEAEALMGVELRLDLHGRDLYLNAYCKAQEVCVVLFDNIQISFILNNLGYKFIFYDTNGREGLRSLTGSSDFYLGPDEEEISAELYQGTPLDTMRVGNFLARRLVEQ